MVFLFSRSHFGIHLKSVVWNLGTDHGNTFYGEIYNVFENFISFFILSWKGNFFRFKTSFFKMFFGKTYCKAIEYKAKLFLISVIVFDSLSMWKVERRKDVQKQPPIGAPRKRCSKNLQQIYRKTPMPRCNFNKVLKQFYWNHTPA